MRRGWKTILLLSVGAAFVVMQMIPAPLTNPPSKAELAAPPEVQATLERSCFHCHSNQTQWPWYSHIAPISWLTVHDVELGRKEINFSEWDAYYPATRRRKLQWLQRALKEEVMPPWSYRVMHPGSRLSDNDRRALRQWIETELAGADSHSAK